MTTHHSTIDRIGIDESGKGDYFGPLVIAAVFVDGTTQGELRLMEVRDSKKISDGRVLEMAGLKDDARYIVFHCADNLEAGTNGNGDYYESIDLIDAFHPQTILAYDLNGAPLPLANGAPLRVRVERQLG
mgnify:CR=1 FL=1